MYNAPAVYGLDKCGLAVDQDELEVCKAQCKPSQKLCDETVFELCCDTMVDFHLDVPTDAREATDLYLFLREKIHKDVFP